MFLLLSQRALHLMLQIVQHVIYLPSIWEIHATFQFKIFLFSLLPPENVEVKNVKLKFSTFLGGKKENRNILNFFPKSRKLYSMLSSYFQHKMTRFVTQHVMLYVT